jgi:uncharacterized membrane protein YhaH (DUF805 family)
MGMEYFIGALKQYATFTGRATRQEYWMFILFYVIFYVVLAVIDGALNMMLLTTIFSVVLLVPSISVAARRLHDTGRTGWWQLIGLIPLIGIIILIVFLAQDSHGDNEYGVNPKLA